MYSWPKRHHWSFQVGQHLHLQLVIGIQRNIKEATHSDVDENIVFKSGGSGNITVWQVRWVE